MNGRVRSGRRVSRVGVVLTLLLLVASVVGAGVAIASAAKPLTSESFGGYYVTEPKTHIKSASVTFTVPTITCHKHYSGVGPSVLIDSTVNKHNFFTYSGGGIAVTCQHNVPVLVALPIVDGVNYNDLNVTITAGDLVTVSVKYGAHTVVTLTDDTTHQVDTRKGKASVGESAYVGDSQIEVNKHSLGLDQFTKTTFSKVMINGRAFGKDKPKRYEWVDHKKAVLIEPSKITDNDHFTTDFKRSS